MESDALAPQEENAEVEVNELSAIKRKMKFDGTVVKTSLAGAVVDIGLEVPGVVHISQLQEKPVNRVEDVVKPGQQVTVWVRRVFPKKKRIELTMVEPLALEWREIQKGMVFKGKAVRLEKFGVFVDVGAERPGLVHISELTHDYIKSPGDVVKEGDEIDVQVLSVNRHKKQIKLSMKALEERPEKAARETTVIESEKEEPVPTAMEMALREAMERNKRDDEVSADRARAKRKGKREDELEDILSRTLEKGRRR